MKIAICGAGAIGGWLGVRLARAGHEVSVVARGESLRAIREHGLRLEEGGRTLSAAVAVSETPATLGVQDLVIIAVKAPSMLGIARGVGPLIGPATMVLTAMNGVPWWFFQGFGGERQGSLLQSVDAGGEIGRLIPPAAIVGGVVHASCLHPEPGLTRHHLGNKLIIGEPSGERTPRIEALVKALTGAGFETVLAEQIQRDIWYKLWGNMTVNPISALTGATTDLLLNDDLVRAFISSVMLEAKEIGARIGIPIEQRPEDRHAVTRKLGAFKTSMLQDVEQGRAVELDALVSVVKELGEIAGVATPYTDVLLGLTRVHARVRGLY